MVEMARSVGWVWYSGFLGFAGMSHGAKLIADVVDVIPQMIQVGTVIQFKSWVWNSCKEVEKRRETERRRKTLLRSCRRRLPCWIMHCHARELRSQWHQNRNLPSSLIFGHSMSTRIGEMMFVKGPKRSYPKSAMCYVKLCIDSFVYVSKMSKHHPTFYRARWFQTTKAAAQLTPRRKTGVCHTAKKCIFLHSRLFLQPWTVLRRLCSTTDTQNIATTLGSQWQPVSTKL